MTNKVVPDTSVLIGGKVSERVNTGKLSGEILILEAALSELENQANKGLTIGFEGLEEITKLKKLSEEGKIKVTFYGERPSVDEIKNARFGAIDAKIREVAMKEKATLITGDYIQFITAQARGIACEHIESKTEEVPGIESFFEEGVMSVHLKEGTIPMAKKGKPGQVDLVPIGDKPTTLEELEHLIREILDYGREHRCTEINMRGAHVVQIDNYRIAIAQPPFSSGVEITAVRPIANVTLDDYTVSDKLRKRLHDRAEGVFICGPPGAGKSSFAAALAEFYRKEKNAIVKTMENPRDLQVSNEITQYAPLEGSMVKTADILLLVRPDYTIYDEVRKSPDFNIFADMRLAGVGMVGVTHAASPMDAVQRLVNRIELGQVPHIVDTIIFIKDAEIRKVYETRMSVKVPVGMMEQDLARPVVEVLDFETGEVEYEIYTFGEEKVIMKVKDAPKMNTVDVTESRNDYVLQLGSECANKEVTVFAGRNKVFTTKIGRNTDFRIPKKGKMGAFIKRAEKYGDAIRVIVEK